MIAAPSPFGKSFILLLAFAVGLMAANVYYPQPILALLAGSLGLRPDAAGLIMTLTQIGYGLGVVFIVPLGDLFENKKLILTTIALTIAAELVLGASRDVLPYFAASLFAGLGASTVQILVPYASHLYDKSMRGRVLGSLMSGLMLGIMLSRPLASLLTDLVSLHAVFFVAAGLMAILWWRLWRRLPSRAPEPTGLGYADLIGSMGRLLLRTPTLQRRAVYQSLMFGAFCLFWTTAPLMLIRSAFHMSQKGVALFALAGVAGAVAAPYAGRLADRGLGRKATIAAFVVGILSFVCSHFIIEGAVNSLIVPGDRRQLARCRRVEPFGPRSTRDFFDRSQQPKPFERLVRRDSLRRRRHGIRARRLGLCPRRLGIRHLDRVALPDDGARPRPHRKIFCLRRTRLNPLPFTADGFDFCELRPAVPVIFQPSAENLRGPTSEPPILVP